MGLEAVVKPVPIYMQINRRGRWARTLMRRYAWARAYVRWRYRV